MYSYYCAADMDKLSEISQILEILEKCGKLKKERIIIPNYFLEYTIRHRDIKSITIFVENSIYFYIDVKVSSREIYSNCGYGMPIPCGGDYICGSKKLQSCGDLLDELQDLGLIYVGNDIKGYK